MRSRKKIRKLATPLNSVETFRLRHDQKVIHISVKNLTGENSESNNSEEWKYSSKKRKKKKTRWRHYGVISNAKNTLTAETVEAADNNDNYSRPIQSAFSKNFALRILKKLLKIFLQTSYFQNSTDKPENEFKNNKKEEKKQHET